MVGTRQFARLLEAADKAKAKVVLVGDPEQLQAIEAGGAFRGILAESGFAELSEVRRQTLAWQQEATRKLATGAAPDALAAYERQGSVIQTSNRNLARSALVEQWSLDQQAKPAETQLILAYTRDDVRKLNELARSVRRERKELGHAELIETSRGTREFASQDRIYFLRNERSLHVKNGTLGTILNLKNGVLEVKLDGTGEHVTIDTRFYHDLDHGYAATVYKAQGATVDRSYVLATSHFDRRATYVALSLHRQNAMMFYAAEDFGAATGGGEGLTNARAREQFMDVLSRGRPKELAHDYLERDESYRYIEVPHPETNTRFRHQSLQNPTMNEIDALQQRAAERWRNKQLAREAEPSVEAELDNEKDLESPQRNLQKPKRLEHPGPEEDFEL